MNSCYGLSSKTIISVGSFKYSVIRIDASYHFNLFLRCSLYPSLPHLILGNLHLLLLALGLILFFVISISSTLLFIVLNIFKFTIIFLFIICFYEDILMILTVIFLKLKGIMYFGLFLYFRNSFAFIDDYERD